LSYEKIPAIRILAYVRLECNRSKESQLAS